MPIQTPLKLTSRKQWTHKPAGLNGGCFPRPRDPNFLIDQRVVDQLGCHYRVCMFNANPKHQYQIPGRSHDHFIFDTMLQKSSSDFPDIEQRKVPKGILSSGQKMLPQAGMGNLGGVATGVLRNMWHPSHAVLPKTITELSVFLSVAQLKSVKNNSLAWNIPPRLKSHGTQKGVLKQRCLCKCCGFQVTLQSNVSGSGALASSASPWVERPPRSLRHGALRSARPTHFDGGRPLSCGAPGFRKFWPPSRSRFARPLSCSINSDNVKLIRTTVPKVALSASPEAELMVSLADPLLPSSS